MMEYDVFKEVVKEQFLNYMPDAFANHVIKVYPVMKVNEMVDKLEVIPPEGSGGRAIPSLSVRAIYEDYRQRGNLTDALSVSAFEYVAAYKHAEYNVEEQILNNVKDKIVMMLINTEQNRELLENVPHREFQDLSIVYRVVVRKDENGIHSALVKNDYADKIGFDEQSLYNAAVQNTERMFPTVVKGMSQVMKEMFVREGMPEELAELYVGVMSENEAMYVITNDCGINGAVSMLYEEGLYELSEKLGSDLYIMPSSIHEAIAVSADNRNPYELAEMVRDINMGEVELNERLSNQVYHYDKDLRKLSLATDTPNKRLDGIVAFVNSVCDRKPFR